MINPITWLWNIRHRKLLADTRRLIRLKTFLEQETGIKHNFNTKELRAGLKALKNK